MEMLLVAVYMDMMCEEMGEDGTKRYRCKNCNHYYKTRKAVLGHLKEDCGVEPQFSCPYCPAKSKRKRNLQRHIVFRHAMPHYVSARWLSKERQVSVSYRPYTCQDCRRTYAHKRALNQHKRYECGKNPQFACTHCPYKAKVRGSLRRHILVADYEDLCVLSQEGLVASEMFHCRCCGRTYKHERTLQTHLRYECGKLPQFACPHCPYKAKLKSNLNKHVVIRHVIKQDRPQLN
ncbi:hypothetical protein J6590_014733 [Homalodisca vitripennis]|nr:hypothetical protein J6590_014733 [Homalodisca vitripennis]